MASASAPPLKTLFSKFEFKIDNRLAANIIRWRKCYEVQYPSVLNTPLLGVEPFGFFPKNCNALFDTLGIDREEFKRAIRQSSIDNSFRVASDDYNLLTIWVAHCFTNTTAISRNMKDEVIQCLFFMLIMKFFSSVCRNFFPYRANRTVMEATIDNLTNKFDIKKPGTSTWKQLFDKRAELMTDTSANNIHYDTLKNFMPDKKIAYVLTNIQTNVRMRVREIATLYYEAVKNGNSVIETNLTGEDKEGNKTIKELQNSYDSMIESICNRALNIQQFIRTDFVKIVCALCSNVKPEMIRTVLMQFSSLATLQYRRNKGDDMDKTGKLYSGYHILISNLIQRTYRACIVDKVPLKRAYILKKAMNLYRSSRIIDPVVVTVKESVSKFVNDTKVSSRDATNSSIKIALILYFILMSFDID